MDQNNDPDNVKTIVLAFQPGPVKLCGCVGFTDESVLAIIHDRMSQLNEGNLPHHNYADAARSVAKAIELLKEVRLERHAKGV